MRRWGILFGVLLLASCLSSKPAASPSRAAITTPGFTTCGNFGLRATTAEAMLPLLSCAGLANVNPLPWAGIRVGEQLHIWNDGSRAHVVLHAGSGVAIDGLSVTGLRAGNTLVTVGGWDCYGLVGPPPSLCPLLRITVG
jgi:hypothetical protein